MVTCGHLKEAGIRLVSLLVRRVEVNARPWGDPVPFERIANAPSCTCCAEELGRVVKRDQKGAARDGDLLVLELLLPSTQREIRNQKDRARRAKVRRAYEARIYAVFA